VLWKYNYNTKIPVLAQIIFIPCVTYFMIATLCMTYTCIHEERQQSTDRNRQQKLSINCIIIIKCTWKSILTCNKNWSFWDKIAFIGLTLFKKRYFFGLPYLATCIFLFFYNEPELGAGIDPGMALTPLSSSIELDGDQTHAPPIMSQVLYR